MTNRDMEKTPLPAGGSIDSSAQSLEDCTPPVPLDVKSIHKEDDSSQTTANADPPAAAVPGPPSPANGDTPLNGKGDPSAGSVAPATHPDDLGSPLVEPEPDKGIVASPLPPKKSKFTRALELIQAQYRLVFTDDGKAYAVDDSGPNPQAFRIGSKEFNSAVRRWVFTMDRALVLTTEDLGSICDQLEALADLTGEKATVWLRVAEAENGIEIDIGDESHARIAVGPGTVKVLRQGCSTLFSRNATLRPFVVPAEKGDLNKLLDYLNLAKMEKWLLIAWISYTLVHPKVPSSNYVILALRGDRGTGKSTLCNIIIGSLVGPTSTGIQAFPGSQRDLAIAAQNAHVVMFDNIRKLTPSQADMLCRCSTSAAVSTRQLYTDGQEYVHQLHCALVLNGVHAFIDQDDFAQRCLALKLLLLDQDARYTEKQLRMQFQQDLPTIFRGLLDLIADILTHLPCVSPKYPERMLEFVHWLAALEKARGFAEGELQLEYRNNLVGAMQDTLQDHPLADSTIQFAKHHSKTPWGGTPADLLIELGKIAGQQVITTRDWPKNPIQLSLRLKKLKSQLSGAGVELTFGKQDRQRHVVVRYTGRSA